MLHTSFHSEASKKLERRVGGAGAEPVQRLWGEKQGVADLMFKKKKKRSCVEDRDEQGGGDERC